MSDLPGVDGGVGVCVADKETKERRYSANEVACVREKSKEREKKREMLSFLCFSLLDI